MAHVEVEVACKVDASSAAQMATHQLSQVMARGLSFIPATQSTLSLRLVFQADGFGQYLGRHVDMSPILLGQNI